MPAHEASPRRVRCQGRQQPPPRGHRSQEWIEKSRYCTSRTYTRQSGLTAAQKRHLGGVDFNPGTRAEMIRQSKRIIAAMKAGLLNEVIEFFGTTDGERVDGWNNPGNRKTTADDSHLWHWHMTLDRRHCANRPLMERILAIALGEPIEETEEEDDVDVTTRVAAWCSHWRTDGIVRGLKTIDIPPLAGAGFKGQRVVNVLATPGVPVDQVDEQEIIDGSLAGLEGMDLDVAAAALRAAFGARTMELATRLAGTAPGEPS